jgi:hypothetical protein
MEVNSILFSSKRGELLQAAALKAGLKHFKEKFGPKGFGVNLHPARTFPALGQVLAIPGNPGESHGLSLGF